MKDVAFVFYSHSEYSDIWSLLFGQSEKFLKDRKKYLLVDSVDKNNIPKDWNVITYDQENSYQDRVSQTLEKVNEEIVIFHHEDMFLLNQPKWRILEKLTEKVKEGKIDLIKLIKASYSFGYDLEIDHNLYLNENKLQFAIQPTIIKKKNLLEIYKNTAGDSIWKFEELANHTVSKLGLISSYLFLGFENKRGMFHWDSLIYPYIATAVVKGRWDFESYPNELKQLHEEYKIDAEERGKNV